MYHKSSGITVMKKNIDADHFTLVKKLVEDPKIAFVKVLTLDQKVSKKRVHGFPHIFGFFFYFH